MSTRYSKFLEALGEHIKSSKYLDSEVVEETSVWLSALFVLETHLFAEPGIYMSMMNGVALQGFKPSHFTHEMIKGQAFTLEDEKSYISQEEALDWSTCNRFSPLGRGFRITLNWNVLFWSK